MSSKTCERCGQKCCRDLLLAVSFKELPEQKEFFNKYPFFIQSGETRVYEPGYDSCVSVPVYSCQKYNPQTGRCEIYNDPVRPGFCEDAGIIFAPRRGCPLFLKTRVVSLVTKFISFID